MVPVSSVLLRAEPDTCINVQVDAPSLSFGSSIGHEAANIARDYLQQHPVYAPRRMGMHAGIATGLIAAALLCPSAAFATQAPPARFDHPHPSLQILERDYLDVDPICRVMFPRARFPLATNTHRILGCAEVGDGKRPCWIIVPRTGEGLISEEGRAEIIRHERAHCNGWPSDHPH